MSGEKRPLIERVMEIEKLDSFPSRQRDKVALKGLGEKNGQLHYELTITRRGWISLAETQS